MPQKLPDTDIYCSKVYMSDTKWLGGSVVVSWTKVPYGKFSFKYNWKNFDQNKRDVNSFVAKWILKPKYGF